MSDEIENVEQTDGQTEETVEEVTEAAEDAIEENDGLSALDGLDEIFEDDDLVSQDTPGEEPGEDSDAEADEYEDIPDEQVDIARQLGYSDEDIVQLAERSPQVLENMVKRFEAKSRDAAPEEVRSQGGKEPDVTPKEKVESPKPFELDGLDKLPAEMQEVLSPLVDRIRSQDAELNEIKGHNESQAQEKAAEHNRKIDTFFDGVAQDLPDVGNSDRLTEAQATNRQEIYGMAAVLQQFRGMNEEAALHEASYMWALSKYDVEGLEKQAEEKVREGLNKSKKRFSPRPGGQKQTKKFKNADEAALHTLKEGLDSVFE